MSLTDRFVLSGIAGGLVLAGIAAWLLLGTPGGGLPSAEPFATPGFVGRASSEPVSTPEASGIVVDVEGAVVVPGIRRLSAGARVADAIAAAGGYAKDADLAASAHALNLAAPLADGDQVYVPRLGETSGISGSGGTGGTGGSGTGLVNLNTAGSDALDALPGIGPATIAKIVAARNERPFTTLDELVERKVLTASQLAGIRDRVTV